MSGKYVFAVTADMLRNLRNADATFDFADPTQTCGHSLPIASISGRDAPFVLRQETEGTYLLPAKTGAHDEKPILPIVRN